MLTVGPSLVNRLRIAQAIHLYPRFIVFQLSEQPRRSLSCDGLQIKQSRRIVRFHGTESNPATTTEIEESVRFRSRFVPVL